MALNEQDSPSVGKSKSTPTVNESSPNTGPTSSDMETLPLWIGQPFHPLICSVEGSPVSHLVPHHMVDERLLASGRKCFALSKVSGPLGSVLRMLMEQPVWYSHKWRLIWKASVIPSHRLLRFRLVPLDSITGGRATGFLHTPTRTANQACPSMSKWPSCRGAVVNSQEWERRMGYPPNWTALEDSVTPSSRKSPKR